MFQIYFFTPLGVHSMSSVMSIVGVAGARLRKVEEVHNAAQDHLDGDRDEQHAHQSLERDEGALAEQSDHRA